MLHYQDIFCLLVSHDEPSSGRSSGLLDSGELHEPLVLEGEAKLEIIFVAEEIIPKN